MQTHGVILAFPSAEALATWCNRLSFAGCIMRDLADQVTLIHMHGEMRLVRPKTPRTATQAQILALKAVADPEKSKQLMNEAYFLLMLDNPGIPRVYG